MTASATGSTPTTVTMIVAEPVMLKLVEAIARQPAHEVVVYEAAQAAATERRPFRELLLADPRGRVCI